MMTITRKLPKPQWQPYFDTLSKHLGLTKVSVIVEGLDVGVQPEIEKVELRAVTYDRGDDILEIDSVALCHRIENPHDVYLLEDVDGALLSFKVTDYEGHEQIVQFDPVLKLPS